jgi:hypothetical protein
MIVTVFGLAVLLVIRALTWLGFAGAGLTKNENILSLMDKLTLDQPRDLTPNPQRQTSLVKEVEGFVGWQPGLA